MSCTENVCNMSQGVELILGHGILAAVIWTAFLILTTILTFCWRWTDDTHNEKHHNPVISYIMVRLYGWTVNESWSSSGDYYYKKNRDVSDGWLAGLTGYGVIAVVTLTVLLLHNAPLVAVCFIATAVLLFGTRAVKRLHKKVAKFENQIAR